MALDPTGTFAYAASAGGLISVYAINSVTGALREITGSPPSREETWEWRQWTRVVTALPGSPLAAGNDPLFVTVDANNKFVYVVNYNGKNVSGYTINLLPRPIRSRLR
jgi:6-phosphogluconolactonase (cycloisomerase 2 family)